MLASLGNGGRVWVLTLLAHVLVTWFCHSPVPSALLQHSLPLRDLCFSSCDDAHSPTESPAWAVQD